MVGNLAYAERYRILGIAIVAPPPNLLLNSDILDILKPSALLEKSIEKSIKQVNLKLFSKALTDLSNSYASLTGSIHSLQNSTPSTTTLAPPSYRRRGSLSF